MATATTNPTHRGAIRYVYGPLSGQTISGTVKGQIRAAESNAGANATLGLAIKIITPAGTDRAVLLAYTAADTFTDNAAPEMATSLTNRSFRDASEYTSISLTSQSATSGDYLVVEIGFRSATGTSRNITYRIGENNASAMEENESSTNDYHPWIEFSGNLLWSQTVTGVTISSGAVVSDRQPTVRYQVVAPYYTNTVTLYEATVAHVVAYPVPLNRRYLQRRRATYVRM